MNAVPLRVLIVDDSRIFRGVIEDALTGREDVQVVGSVWSGEKALEFARESLPDFVTLDIEMPGMGGIETLKALRVMARSQQRTIGVLLISSHTQRGAAVTMEGLAEGAFDFIPKPDSGDAAANTAQLRQQLLAKLDAFRSRRRIDSPTPPPLPRSTPIRHRSTRYRAVVIGASTGGPEALTRLIPVLTPVCPVPMFLVQHLPADFIPHFAASMSRRFGAKFIEAQAGTVPEPGVLYLAPGGQHLLLNRIGGQIEIGFSDSPSENGFRPAADVLFRSAALAYGGDVLTVVLTGMGSDGARGAAVIKRAGGHVIVQDEATSTVWGMPGSVVAAGAADEILPIHRIGPALLAHLGIGERAC